MLAFVATFESQLPTTVVGELRALDNGVLEVVPQQQQQSDSPEPQQLYGRGVGTWQRLPSGIVEAELELYMYTTSSQPPEPVRLKFLGVCSAGGGGGVRGCLFAADGAQEQIGTMVGAPLAPARTQLARTLRVAPAAANSQPPITSIGRRPRLDFDLEEYRVGNLESVYYIPDYLSAEDEAEVHAQLAASPPDMWRRMSGRRVQECGTRMAPSGDGLMLEQLPPWMEAVATRGSHTLHMHMHSHTLHMHSHTQHMHSPTCMGCMHTVHEDMCTVCRTDRDEARGRWPLPT